MSLSIIVATHRLTKANGSWKFVKANVLKKHKQNLTFKREMPQHQNVRKTWPLVERLPGEHQNSIFANLT